METAKLAWWSPTNAEIILNAQKKEPFGSLFTAPANLLK
jgi:hypothetical protein